MCFLLTAPVDKDPHKKCTNDFIYILATILNGEGLIDWWGRRNEIRGCAGYLDIHVIEYFLWCLYVRELLSKFFYSTLTKIVGISIILRRLDYFIQTLILGSAEDF